MGLFALAAASPALAAEDHHGVEHQLRDASVILHEMTAPGTPAGIPSAVLKDAKCVAVVPNLFQGGFMFGVRRGEGVATCREGARWSPPAPFSLTGISFGAQLGGQDISLVMMIMNDNGMQELEQGHFKVGGGVSAAAGPVGRQAAASAGWGATILSYSRTRGIYAGAVIKGAELNQNHDATELLYGHDYKFDRILNGQVPMPKQGPAVQFVQTVNHVVRRADEKAHS